MRRLMQSVVILALFAAVPEIKAQGNQATEARVITFTDHGFEPTAVTVKPGPVWLIVRSKVPGPRVFELTSTLRKLPDVLLNGGNKRVARQVVSLAPGDYEISDPRYPQWKCKVRVQP